MRSKNGVKNTIGYRLLVELKTLSFWRVGVWVGLCGTLGLAPWGGGDLFIGPRPLSADNLWTAFFWDNDVPWLGMAILTFGVLLALLSSLWGIDIWRFPVGRATLPLVAMVGWFWISTLFSAFPTAALHRSAEWLIALCLLFCIVGVAGRGRLTLALLVSLVVGATLVSLRAGREYAENYFWGHNPAWRVFSTFYNPDFLAGYLVMSVPVTWSLLLWLSMQEEKTPFQRASSHLLTASGWLQMSAVLLTGSRFGMVALIVSVLLFFGIERRHIRGEMLIRIALVLVLLGVVAWVSSPAMERLTPQAAQREVHSGGFRLYTWRGTLDLIQDHPLTGTGPGSFQWTYPKYALVGFTQLTHNSYLEIASEAGLPALFLLLAFGVGWLTKVLQREMQIPGDAGMESMEVWKCGSVEEKKRKTKNEKRKTPNLQRPFKDWRILQTGILAAVVGAGLRNAVDSDIAIFANLLTLFALLGLGIALAVDAVYPLPIGRLSRRVFGVGLSVLLGWHFLAAGMSELYGALAGGRLPADPLAEAYYRQSLWWQPENTYSLYGLATVQYVRGHKEETFSLLQQAVRAEPSARSYYRLGLYYEGDGKAAEALQAYDRALERDPHHLAALLHKARLLAATEPVQSLQTYERLVQIEGSLYNQVRAMPEIVETAYGFAHLALGSHYEKGGDLQRAEQEYRRALEVFEEYRTRTYPFNLALRSLGQFNSEKEREILQAHLNVLERLERLLKTLGREPESLTMHEKYQQLLKTDVP